MLINIMILAVAAIFSAYVLYSVCRKYIGLNPQAPSPWARVKAWWPGFVKRHIVDDDPYQDESHAGTRYAEDYVDWSKVPDGYDWVANDGDFVLAWDRKPKPYEPAYYPGWTVGGGGYWPLKNDAITGPLPPWRDSLRHRPGK